MIRLEGVWYRYPGSQWVLRGVDAEIPDRGVTVVVGPNGSGKTTMLKVAGLVYKPQRGRVEAWGVDAWLSDGKTRLQARRRVVYVHEKPVMLRGTVLDNIVYGLRLRGIPREEAQRKAERVAREVGVDSLLGEPSARLSAGQAQLVALARALAVEPRILLLDEPFAHLDIAARRSMAGVLLSFRDRMGVVIATHDYMMARRLADRVIVVEDGRARPASPEELEPL